MARRLDHPQGDPQTDERLAKDDGDWFGAVVVEAGVEALEGFRVVKPQDGTSQQGKHLASAGFLARTRGVFFP
jgi:hypothetical protein